MALAAVAIGVLAVVFRVGVLDKTPEFDELYHLLAAQGWLETGRPIILDGEYTRTAWFTGIVAWLFSVTGSPTLETGRLVAMVAGSLVPVVLFLWLQARAGWSVALIAAGLTILWPQGIAESQLLRFYSWQVLAFLAGAIAAYEAAVMHKWGRRAAWTAVATAAFLVGLSLQITTMVGIAAVVVWIGGAVLLPAIWRHPSRWPLLGALALAGLAALALLAWSGILAEIWARYRWSAGWAEAEQGNVFYYHFHLLRSYPLLWPLLPFALLFALRRQPRLGAYCAVLFGTILVAHSFGGMKSLRYLSYGMPFLFVLFGLAAAEILPAAAGALRRTANHLNPTRHRWISAALVAGACAFVALANPFVEISIKALLGRTTFGPPEADWTRMDDLLAEWESMPFRITTRELHTIANLGDYDVLYDASRLTEITDPVEFAVDPRTGRPVVGELDSVARILGCKPEGVLLAERAWWENEGGGAGLLPLFADAGREVEIRTGRALVALRWSDGPAAPDTCATLPL